MSQSAGDKKVPNTILLGPDLSPEQASWCNFFGESCMAMILKNNIYETLRASNKLINPIANSIGQFVQ